MTLLENRYSGIKSIQRGRRKELGWFAAFDLNSPDMVITMMIEDVKGRGGSNIPAEK